MILNFIAFARVPLTIPWLEHAISVPTAGGTLEPSDIIRQETISKLCSSLVRKSGDGRGFEFAHFSVREFLDSEDLAEFGLGHFRVSGPSCDRQLAIQRLRYLLLDNFDQSPEPTMESIKMLMRENEHDEFYMYASTFRVDDASGGMENPVVTDLVARLFDPRKTPAFTRWAVTLRLHWLFLDDEEDWETATSTTFDSGCQQPSDVLVTAVSNILDRNFRPLHLAALLGLSGICRQHLELVDNSPSLVNLRSPLGTPLQCAVARLRLFTRRSANIHDVPFRQSGARRSSHRVTQTVDCLLVAGAECADWPRQDQGRSLLAAALLTALELADFTCVSLLLPRVATITDADLEFAEYHLTRVAEYFYDGDDEISFIKALQPFVMALNHLSKASPGVLPLACMVWKIALGWDSNITKLTSLLDTRIWLAEDALPNWAISVTSSADAESLESLLSDPRVIHSTIRTKDGGSLLHVATSLDGRSVDLKDYLVTAIRLLDAGFSPAAVNDAGKTPLHVWNWQKWHRPNSDSEVLEDLIRAFVRAGLDINMQDQCGQNVLHATVRAGHERQLEAILNVVDKEALDKALRATSLEGYTPLMEALRLGHESSASAILEFCALDPRQPGFERSAQILLASGMCVAGNEHIDPLHQLGQWPSLRCVRWLKALYPQSCGTRVDGRLPLDRYLHQRLVSCFIPPSFHEIALELAALDVGEDNKDVKASTWDYFTTTVLTESRAGGTRVRPNLSRTVLSVIQCLVKSGYLKAHEAVTNQSGLAPMLAAFGPKEWRNMDDLWPLSGESIATVVEVTLHWSLFESSPIAASLLRAAFESCDVRVVDSVLERGMDLYQTHGVRSCLAEVCRCDVRENDGQKKIMFQKLLDYAGSDRLNDLDPASGQLGLIHQAAAGGSVWVVEELVRRGADPDLRTGPAAASQPAVVHHLSEEQLGSALALFHQGADPTKRDAMGIDSALAAAYSGCSSFLEALAEAEEKFTLRIDWQQTCSVTHQDSTDAVSSLNALHLSALSGDVNCLRFYLDRKALLGIDGVSSEGYTPLLYASWNGNLQAVEYLCHKGAAVNFQSPLDGSTALHLAVWGNSLEVVHVLLQYGAKLQTDHAGRSPLILAYQGNDQSLIEALQSPQDALGPSVKATSGPSQDTASIQQQQQQQRKRERGLASSLEHAVRSGNLEFCNIVYESGGSLDADLGCGGCSALVLATSQRKLDIVKWLLDNGASSTKVSCCHRPYMGYETPLQIALREWHAEDAELIRLLMDKFVDDGGDISEQKFLTLAASCGNTTALGMLLERGKREGFTNYPRYGSPELEESEAALKPDSSMERFWAKDMPLTDLDLAGLSIWT
jgi:ankyrin repeat protein